MLPPRRAPLLLLQLAILLGIATPFLGVLLSFGYLEPSSRSGPLYFWLYELPDNLTSLLPFTPRPGARLLTSVAGYTSLYLAVALLSRSAWRRLQRVQ
jgi:hypothetical protein